MNAEIITIGDEILLGQIVDTNSAWIGQQFDDYQINVRRITSISDQKDIIYAALQQASTRSDLIIITGGLGPTKDDVTKEAISAYFNSPLIRSEEVLLHITQLFQKLGKVDMPVANFAQADVLACADVLFNDVGTAPGMWVEYEGRIYVFLPGVPFEMKYLMDNRVLPKLIGKRDSYTYHAHIITAGIGESHLAVQIADIEEMLPDYIKLAYLPKIGLVRLRLTAIGANMALLKEQTDLFAKKIAERLSDFLVATRDISLEQTIVEQFSKYQLKLATAESCTGGKIAGQLTQVSGASQIFDCSVVAYQNSVKEQLLGVSSATLESYGAVSEQTVIEMAHGIKRLSGANYGIATSGIAGPGGGTEEKPVGTVWIAVSGQTETITKKFQFHNDRLINMERATMQSLILLWHLYRKEIGDFSE